MESYLQKYNRLSLYDLGLDVIAIIVSYIRNPEDLQSLYDADPWLFKNIHPRYVEKLYVDPDTIQFIPVNILDKYPKLVSSRCDLRVESLADLRNVQTHPRLKEACVRLGSSNAPTLFNSIDRFMWNEDLVDKAFRFERWNPERSYLEHIWIGRGRIAGNPDIIFPYLVLYDEYITEIITDILSWMEPDYVDVLSTLESLTKIIYIDHGYNEYTTDIFITMLNLNDTITSIECVPCSYLYRVDLRKGWKQVDDMIVDIIYRGEQYPDIREILIPFSQKDICLLPRIFPTLTGFGVRIVLKISKVNNPFSSTHLFEEELKDFFKPLAEKYNKIKIFLVIKYKGDMRKEVCRNPEMKAVISKEVSDKMFSLISSFKTSVDIIDYEKDLPSDITYSDNWLFREIVEET